MQSDEELSTRLLLLENQVRSAHRGAPQTSRGPRRCSAPMLSLKSFYEFYKSAHRVLRSEATGSH